jgi:hypothetical protein
MMVGANNFYIYLTIFGSSKGDVSILIVIDLVESKTEMKQKAQVNKKKEKRITRPSLLERSNGRWVCWA